MMKWTLIQLFSWMIVIFEGWHCEAYPTTEWTHGLSVQRSALASMDMQSLHVKAWDQQSSWNLIMIQDLGWFSHK